MNCCFLLSPEMCFLISPVQWSLCNFTCVAEALVQDHQLKKPFCRILPFVQQGQMPLCRTTAKKTSIASASIFFILCFLLSLLRNAFVTKLKECSNHDEILYICCLVFEILLLVSCVRAPEDFFARVLQQGCWQEVVGCLYRYFALQQEVQEQLLSDSMWMHTYFSLCHCE